MFEQNKTKSIWSLRREEREPKERKKERKKEEEEEEENDARWLFPWDLF